MRRGDLRLLLLAGLLDGPAHGYELMKRLEETTGGRWRPSPGSIYPMLQLLEDEGLVRAREDEGRRVYELTELGTEQADRTKLDELIQGPDGRGGSDLRNEVRLMHLAAKQVGVAGTPEQVEQASTIVREARQALYRLLTD
jgi:DNA-binding PadR family transcriptional regulator